MPETKNSKQTEKNVVRSIYEWVETFCIALFSVVVIFTFVCRFVTVDGSSMINTLHHGDRLVISNLFYKPACGDIVVVQDANEPFFRGPVIKRIIAIGGETVDIDPETWTITVTDKDGNTRTLDEPYVNKDINVDGKLRSMHLEFNNLLYKNAITYDQFPHTVEEGCVFVLGDNRNDSLDSRFIGDIDQRKILGKAYLRLFPLSDFKYLG